MGGDILHEKRPDLSLVMIPRPRARPQSLLQAVTRPSLCLSSRICSSQPFPRSYHNLPELSNGKDAVFSKYGVPGFLSPAAYDETWTQYQTALCDYLNDETQGTTLESIHVKKLHEITAKQPSKAALYNHAAQAHHNHFFFNGLSAIPEPHPPNHTVQNCVQEWFEGMEHLRDEMVDTAMAMFGNGYVWLMADGKDGGLDKSALSILCTYNAGSPFAAAHARRQPLDGQTAGSFGNQSRHKILEHERSFDGTPILRLKVWEHQWMRDYGLAGKQVYVQNWWNRIDWDEVVARLVVVRPTEGQQSTTAPGAARNQRLVDRLTQPMSA